MFTFTQGDQVASFAVANALKLRGHTLVWHKYVVYRIAMRLRDLTNKVISQLPAWVSTLQGNSLLSVMNNHITTGPLLILIFLFFLSS